MDTPTVVAILGFFGTLFASAIGIVVAIITNRAEKAKTAETTMEKTLRERLVLRDEQMAELKMDLLEEREKNKNLRAENHRIRSQGVPDEQH